MSDEQPDRTAVHVVELGGHHLESLLAHESLDHGERVVLEVLVHDRVECVGLKHHRQIVQLDDPDPALRERLGDVGDERARVLEVVEHRDARDRLGLLVGPTLSQSLRGVEVVDDVVSLGDRIPRNIGGVETEVAQPLSFVPVQQGAVVAADVDDKVTGLQRHDRFDPMSYAVKVVRSSCG